MLCPEMHQELEDDLVENAQLGLEAGTLTLENMNATLREKRVVVMTAVEVNGKELKYAATALRADREVVLTAVDQCGRALEFASAELRADREVVLAAVHQRGSALEFAPARLQAAAPPRARR